MITEEMIEAGAEAYHEAIAKAKTAYYKRHSHRSPSCTPSYKSCPAHWIEQVYMAMKQLDDD